MAGIAPTPAPDGAKLVYPRAAIVAALARAGAGMGITLGPLAIIEPTPVASLFMGGLGLVFAAYGVQAVIRARSEVIISSEGICLEGPIATRVSWDTLVSMKLSYYTIKRSREDGWMVLTIKGTGRAVRIESSLEGFASLLARAVSEALVREVMLPAATRSNLRPFGIDADARPV